MQVKDYIASRESFVKNGIRFQIVSVAGGADTHMSDRMMCSSIRKSNKEGTNGVRIPYTGGFMPGFYAFMTESDLSRAVDVLAEESRENEVQFILDDELTEELGARARYFYQMRVLRSRVV
ncbi:MAG: hypothetical protein WC444_00275 [Candidatus Paceibacterota bacterium]